MHKYILLLISILLFLISACRDSSVILESQERIVVEAFIYANEPVEDIRLTLSQPLDVEEDVAAPPVNDAIVALIRDGQRYSLVSSAGDSGYYHYSGTDLEISAGDVWHLEIDYQGQSITAETIVPEAPTGVSSSGSSISIPSFEDIRNGGGTVPNLEDLTVTVSWENVNEELFYVVFENLESDPDPINSDLPFLQRRIRFPPTRRNEFRIGAFSMTHLGTHLIKVYRVNQEYADLYETQEQDSRDLNEPLSNINNGLGVFSAFHSDNANLLLEVEDF